MDSLKNMVREENKVIVYAIAIFWFAFYFLSVIDKFITDPTYLWVGKNRLAQFSKLFISLGFYEIGIVIFFLTVVTILEFLALIVFSNVFWHLIKKNYQVARTTFFLGTILSLSLFTFFAVGDQFFGERFELLEHSLYWLLVLASWLLFRNCVQKEDTDNGAGYQKLFSKKNIVQFSAILVFVSFFSFISIHSFTMRTINTTPDIIVPTYVGYGIYRFDIPFIAGTKVWEKSIVTFMENNPSLDIKKVAPVPEELQSKADYVIMHLFTSKVGPGGGKKF